MNIIIIFIIHLHYINIYLIKENKETEKLNDDDSVSILQNLKESEIVVVNISNKNNESIFVFVC